MAKRFYFLKELESLFHENKTNDFAILLCDDLKCCQNRVYDKGYFFQIKKNITTF